MVFTASSFDTIGTVGSTVTTTAGGGEAAAAAAGEGGGGEDTASTTLSFKKKKQLPETTSYPSTIPHSILKRCQQAGGALPHVPEQVVVVAESRDDSNVTTTTTAATKPSSVKIKNNNDTAATRLKKEKVNEATWYTTLFLLAVICNMFMATYLLQSMEHKLYGLLERRVEQVVTAKVQEVEWQQSVRDSENQKWRESVLGRMALTRNKQKLLQDETASIKKLYNSLQEEMESWRMATGNVSSYYYRSNQAATEYWLHQDDDPKALAIVEAPQCAAGDDQSATNNGESRPAVLLLLDFLNENRMAAFSLVAVVAISCMLSDLCFVFSNLTWVTLCMFTMLYVSLSPILWALILTTTAIRHPQDIWTGEVVATDKVMMWQGWLAGHVGLAASGLVAGLFVRFQGFREDLWDPKKLGCPWLTWTHD